MELGDNKKREQVTWQKSTPSFWAPNMKTLIAAISLSVTMWLTWCDNNSDQPRITVTTTWKDVDLSKIDSHGSSSSTTSPRDVQHTDHTPRGHNEDVAENYEDAVDDLDDAKEDLEDAENDLIDAEAELTRCESNLSAKQTIADELKASLPSHVYQSSKEYRKAVEDLNDAKKALSKAKEDLSEAKSDLLECQANLAAKQKIADRLKPH